MKRILVVDDEEKIRGIYRRLLESKGYEVIEASHVEEATYMLMKEMKDKIDLVLLDINMPELDGSQVADFIQEFDPYLKIIVISVYPVDEQQKMIPNATDYYDKAEKTSTLLNKIKKALLQEDEI